MKTKFTFNLILVMIFMSMISFAQTPQTFKYQTVVRNAAGEIISNQNVSFRFSIRNGNSGGPVVYRETHTVLTNQFGLAVLNIGTGTPVSGVFSAIDWGSGSKFLQVELDPAGGSAYVTMGTSQLLSVPYALYSENTANVDDADADPENELQTISKVGNTVTLSDGGGAFTDETEDADADPTNEIQTLSVAGNELSISDGNTVTLPSSGTGERIADSDGDTWIDTESNNDNDSIVFTTFGMRRMVISNNGYVEVSGQMIATGFQGDGSGLTGVPGDNLGDHTASEELDMSNHRITNVVSPVNANDAATKLYVDTNGGDDLGDHTATQNIRLNGNRLSNDGGNEGIAITNEGKVGINTDTPDQQLTVNGNIRSEGQVMAQYGAADNPSIRFGSGTENTGLASPYVNSVSVITNGSERIVVRHNGNVGIGTSNPQTPLHVNGSIRMVDGNQAAGRILVSDANGTGVWSDPGVPTADNDWEIVGDDMYAEVSGNVGIGTDTPGAKLEVAGHISQTGTGNSTFIGEGAGVSDDLTNNENVFIGKEAGSANTSGGQNTATGYESLQSNIDGDYNTAFGNKALESNTTADGNTAVGYASLNKNTTGQGNTAMGTSALNNNTSGTNNTASGTQALYNNLTGQSNSATGYQAQYYNNGHQNTALGSQALKYQEDGNRNTAVGYEAGSGTTFHSKWGGVFIGYQAGRNEMDDNKLYIENSSSSTPLIGGNFAYDEVYLNGDVGIGTSTPTAELDVNGQVKTSGLEVNGPAVVNGQIQITGGNPGTNKVLMSDASGLASWSAQGGGGGVGASMATAYMNANNMFSPHTNNCGADAFIPLFPSATVGFCMERNERPEDYWQSALATCLAAGKRLPEVWEYLWVCPYRAYYGIDDLFDYQSEWASNFAVPELYAASSGSFPENRINVTVFGGTNAPQNCFQSSAMPVASEEGILQVDLHFRCVR